MPDDSADKCCQGYGTALGVITNLFETGRLERAYYTQSTREAQALTLLKVLTFLCDSVSPGIPIDLARIVYSRHSVVHDL